MENTSLHWEYNLIFTSIQRKCTCYNAWTNFFLFCIDKNNKKTEGAAEKYIQKMLRLQHHMCITVVSYKHTCVAKPNLYFNSHCAGAYCNSRCNKISLSLSRTHTVMWIGRILHQNRLPQKATDILLSKILFFSRK